MAATLMIAALWWLLKQHATLPVARTMHRWLVEKPADRLNHMDRRHVIMLVLFALILAFGGELLAAAGPLDLSMVLLWDVSVYLDAVMVSVALATAARSVSAGRYIKRTVARRFNRAGHARRPRSAAARSTRRATNSRSSAHDDDRAPLALAA